MPAHPFGVRWYKAVRLRPMLLLLVGVWEVAGFAGAARTESKGVFKPTPDQQLNDIQAWNRWQELISQYYFLTEFPSPEPISMVVTTRMTQLLTEGRPGRRHLPRLEAVLLTLTQQCGARASSHPVTMTFSSKEGAPMIMGLSTPAIVLTGGIACLNEEEWKFITRRSGIALPGRVMEAVTPLRERQMGEAELIKTELAGLTQLLGAAPATAQRMRELLASAYLAYEGRLAAALRDGKSLREVSDRLKKEWAAAPPAWPHVEKRILDEGFPSQEDQFEPWRAALVFRLNLRFAVSGRSKPREAPNGFAASLIERLSKKQARSTKMVVPMEDEEDIQR